MNRTGTLLAPLIRNLGLEGSVKLSAMRREWRSIFEEPVSFHTSPALLKDGELLINVDSPAWLQQLHFFKETIIKKLQCFGILSVRFRVGKVFHDKAQAKPVPKHRNLSNEEKTYVEQAASSIADSELRERIKKAIEKSMTFERSR